MLPPLHPMQPDLSSPATTPSVVGKIHPHLFVFVVVFTQHGFISIGAGKQGNITAFVRPAVHIPGCSFVHVLGFADVENYFDALNMRTIFLNSVRQFSSSDLKILVVLTIKLVQVYFDLVDI